MASLQTAGQRPGESYLAWKQRELAEREALARGETPPPSAPPPEDVSHAAMNAAATAPAPAVNTPIGTERWGGTSSGITGAAWLKVGRALGDVAGRVIEKARWASGRVYNPKILQVDVKRPERPMNPPANWARDVAQHFQSARVVGEDVSTPFFTVVVNEIEKIALDGHGFVQRAFQSIGRLAGLGRMEGNWGRETVRKCIRWLEDHGWIGTLNALYRDEETRELKRDANVYQLFSKNDAAEISAVEDPSARALKRESLTLSRGAILWGLMVRPWGLNATPSPSNRHQTRTRAAPA